MRFDVLEPPRTYVKDIRESEVRRVFSHKFVVQAHRTSSNLLKMNALRESEVCRVFSPTFRVFQAHRTSSNLLRRNDIRESEVCTVLSQWFKHIELHRTSSKGIIVGRVRNFIEPTHRTSSNLLEPQHHRDSKVWRGLSHEVGVVRLYRTFSIYLVTGETRSAGCLSNSSGWFKHIEPQRTYSNHIITEIARCGEVCHMRSGWFACTEPSLSTSLQGKQGVHGASALVQGGSSTSNHFITERARCSEWFDCTEHSLTASLQGKRGVQGASALARGVSSTSNLIEPPQNVILERARCVEFYHISSGWFKHIAPQRTSSKGMILERARCVEFFHISSGCFKHFEPHRTSSE